MHIRQWATRQLAFREEIESTVYVSENPLVGGSMDSRLLRPNRQCRFVVNRSAHGHHFFQSGNALQSRRNEGLKDWLGMLASEQLRTFVLVPE